jgi:hypothetical protein
VKLCSVLKLIFRIYLGDPANTQANKCELYKCLRHLEKKVVLTIKMSIKGKPGEVVLDNPTLLGDNKFTIALERFELLW